MQDITLFSIDWVDLFINVVRGINVILTVLLDILNWFSLVCNCFRYVNHSTHSALGFLVVIKIALKLLLCLSVKTLHETLPRSKYLKNIYQLGDCRYKKQNLFLAKSLTEKLLHSTIIRNWYNRSRQFLK